MVTAGFRDAYNPHPCAEPVGGEVLSGWAVLAGRASRSRVLAIDGPEIAPWHALLEGLRAAMDKRGSAVCVLDARDGMAPWEAVVAATSSTVLSDDPDFERLATASLPALFDQPVRAEPDAEGVTVIAGPGAALSPHDALWYVDYPKRHAEVAVAAGTGHNLGQRDAPGNPTKRRLFYVDWPILDRHRDAIAPTVSLWIDASDPQQPSALDASTLAATAASLVQRPFRTRPVFNSTVWGGHWAQRRLGIGLDQPNTAVGYELIAPESGVLIGVEGAPTVEIPLQLLVSLHPIELLGDTVHRRFGTSFPIRFDYLDTVGGDSLSVHCHPRPDNMRDIFGWAYAQHESYYLVHTTPGSRIFLGLAADTDVDDFHADVTDAADRGRGFDISGHVQSFPATAHQLYLVPAGTPHGSSEGNVVLEVSATPYLYSLRFYDWMRTDSNGSQRSVRPDLAFDNLDPARSGARVAADLIPAPRRLRSGPGWVEEVLGELPELFFDVRRLEIAEDGVAPDDTSGRFHVLNVVEGIGVDITTSTGAQLRLAYAETALVPAAVGAYTIAAAGSRPARVVKALVR